MYTEFFKHVNQLGGLLLRKGEKDEFVTMYKRISKKRSTKRIKCVWYCALLFINQNSLFDADEQYCNNLEYLLDMEFEVHQGSEALRIQERHL